MGRPAKVKPHQYPAQVGGMPAIAAIVAKHFGVRCQRQDIHKWRSLAPEPFPSPDNGNRFSVLPCLDWYERNMLKGGKTETLDLFQEQAEAKAKNDIEKLAHDRWLREVEKGRWVERTLAKRTCIGALKKYHGFVRDELERDQTAARLEKLRELGLSVEALGAFQLYDGELARALVDRIEERCAKETDEVE